MEYIIIAIIGWIYLIYKIYDWYTTYRVNKKWKEQDDMFNCNKEIEDYKNECKRQPSKEYQEYLKDVKVSKIYI